MRILFRPPLVSIYRKIVFCSQAVLQARPPGPYLEGVVDLESVVAGFLKAGKIKVLSFTAATILPIALADWYIGSKASLGVLYILPMMMAATVLVPAGTVCLAFLCSFLRSLFDLPSPHLEAMLRFIFAVLAYSGSGLFVTALIRNRDLVLEHLSPANRNSGAASKSSCGFWWRAVPRRFSPPMPPAACWHAIRRPTCCS